MLRDIYDNLLFDLDGTLTDSKPGLVNAIEFAVRKMGLAPLPQAVVEKFLGPPLFGSFEKHCGISGSTTRTGEYSKTSLTRASRNYWVA